MTGDEKINVLIVDDSMTARHLVSEMITSLGHQTQTAASSLEALDMLNQGDFDLVLTDLVMPDIDGLDLLTSIRQRWPDMPVLLMTAHASLSSAVTALRRGVDDILIKPIYPELVTRRIEAIVDRRQSRHKTARSHRLEGALAMAGTAAHELNQPLTAIMASAEMLNLTQNPARVKELAARIINASEQLGRLTRKLARVVRFETMNYLDQTKILDLDASSDSEQ